MVSSQTAFYEVYIDYGEGAQYFGIFTAVEIVDDTLIESQFSDDSGNVYKPDGAGAVGLVDDHVHRQRIVGAGHRAPSRVL